MKKEYKKMSLLNYLMLTSFLLVIAFTQFHILISFGQKNRDADWSISNNETKQLILENKTKLEPKNNIKGVYKGENKDNKNITLIIKNDELKMFYSGFLDKLIYVKYHLEGQTIQFDEVIKGDREILLKEGFPFDVFDNGLKIKINNDEYISFEKQKETARGLRS